MDIQAEPNILEKYMAIIITALLGLIIGICLEKIRNKITFLKYRISYQPLATTSQDNYWGDITVMHNQRTVKHLIFATIELKNDTNRDLEKLDVDIWVDKLSQFLAIRANYLETGNSILLEQNYYNNYSDVLQKVSKETEDAEGNTEREPSIQLLNELQFVMSNKKFHLPIFNRHTTIVLNLLIENFEGQKPETQISVLHKSVKLVLETDKEVARKKTIIWMLSIGFVIYAVFISFVIKFYPASVIPITLSVFIGLTYSIFGFVFYRLAQLLKRFLS